MSGGFRSPAGALAPPCTCSCRGPSRSRYSVQPPVGGCGCALRGAERVPPVPAPPAAPCVGSATRPTLFVSHRVPASPIPPTPAPGARGSVPGMLLVAGC